MRRELLRKGGWHKTTRRVVGLGPVKRNSEMGAADTAGHAGVGVAHFGHTHAFIRGTEALAPPDRHGPPDPEKPGSGRWDIQDFVLLIDLGARILALLKAKSRDQKTL
ncbi:MAG: hypothetical protein KF731_16045 [Thauera sp.]|nr:hypothetical protein [Thauera sp.]